MPSRRSFVVSAAGSVLAMVSGVAPAGASWRLSVGRARAHPEPRPGIDGSRVLAAADVAPRLKELFDQIRAIAEIVDGVRCHCGCADVPDMYSLLSCYEGTGMAQFCEVCQGEGRLVARLRGEGRTLAEIRKAVDDRFG